MRRKYEEGEIIGQKRIIKFIAKRGKYDYYKVECVACGDIRVMNGDYIRRHTSTGCIICGKKDLCLRRRSGND